MDTNMAFGIGINAKKPDRGEIKGTQEGIACGCWFTNQGTAIPKMIKYQDQDGMIHTITNLEVLFSEKQYFCGIPVMAYSCRTEYEGKEYLFRLLFHLEECKWKIVWNREM